jgi:group I intron endonuclease
MDVAGIYLLRNAVNGKVYVGQSIHTWRRWHEHKKCAKRGDKSHLYDAMRKYGADVFEHEVLEVCTPYEFDVREAYWMEQYDCRNQDKGYNLMPAGQLGRVMDDDCRERIASKLRGRKVSPERLAQMKIESTGRKHSEETKKKISDGNKGSNGPNTKIAAALKARYAAFTDEQKQEYADKRRGFKHTDESRQAMSDQRKGKPKSEATKAKMRDQMQNQSQEAKENRLAALAIANKKRWDAYRAQKDQLCLA